MKMKEVICDTNIWYGIGKGDINPEDLKDVRLIATYVNFLEIGSSYHIIKNLEFTQAACQAIKNHSSKAIILSPIHYIKSLDDSCFDYPHCGENEPYDQVNKIASCDTSLLKKSLSSNYCKIKNQVEDFKNPAVQAAKALNEVAQDIQNENSSKKEHRKKSHIESIKDIISNQSYKSLGSEISEDFDWGQIDCLLNLIDSYLKEIEVSGRQFRPNDWMDLFQFAYVNPERQIWTKERKWNQYLRENDMKDHIFEPSKQN